MSKVRTLEEQQQFELELGKQIARNEQLEPPTVEDIVVVVDRSEAPNQYLNDLSEAAQKGFFHFYFVNPTPYSDEVYVCSRRPLVDDQPLILWEENEELEKQERDIEQEVLRNPL